MVEKEPFSPNCGDNMLTPAHLEKLTGLSFHEVEDFNIFLAHDIDNAELGRQRVPFYDRVAEVGENLGHKVFVPYRFTKFPGEEGEMKDTDTVRLMDMMVSHSKLILCYLGINSTSVGHFIGHAMNKAKDIIYFYEKGTQLETVAQVEGMFLGGIPAEEREEVRKEPRVLWHRNQGRKLYRYPNVMEVIEFETEQECYERLEAAIKKHIIT